jgi:hypothetical protein
VAKLSALRFRLAGALVVAAVSAVLAAPVANAGGGLLGGLLGSNCQTGGTQVFASWGDFANYYLAVNGGLENGSTGWTLTGGAAVVQGNEPFLPTGTHSLSLPSGSTATSPVTCIGPRNIYVRMFGADRAGTDQGLHVRVLWYGLLNKLIGATDFNTFGPGSDWAPTSKLPSGGGMNVLLPLLGSTSARIQLTPLGSDSNWQIDDVYVDPAMGR